MESVIVDQPVRVGAAFDRQRVLPVWFMWNGRYYRVSMVSYSWESYCGSALLHHYSVSDGDNQYELQFDSRSLEWTLQRVCTG